MVCMVCIVYSNFFPILGRTSSFPGNDWLRGATPRHCVHLSLEDIIDSEIIEIIGFQDIFNLWGLLFSTCVFCFLVRLQIFGNILHSGQTPQSRQNVRWNTYTLSVMMEVLQTYIYILNTSSLCLLFYLVEPFVPFSDIHCSCCLHHWICRIHNHYPE